MIKKLNYRERYGLKVGLRGYQRRAVALAIEKLQMAFFMAPRLGKTRVCLAVCGYWHLQKEADRVVVVCPSIAKDVWETEIGASLDFPTTVRVVQGKADERKLILKDKDDKGLTFLIINFEATWRLKKFLYKWNPDIIIVDESHRIAGHATKQSRTLHTLGTRAKYRMIATGTWGSKPTHLFSQFKFLAPWILGTRWKDFLESIVDKWGFRGFKPETFKNLDELYDRVGEHSFFLTREQAGGFPQELIQVIHFDLTGKTARHYGEMEEQMRTIVRGTRVTAKIVLTQALRLQQITGGFLPVPDPDTLENETVPLGNDRLQALLEITDEYAPGEPLVIYARFRYEIEQIKGAMLKRGRKVGVIAGGVEGRDQVKKDFQAGLLDTCVVQIRAGGIAIDLSRADNGIFYSMTGSYLDFEQAKSRIIARTGGKKAFLILVARDTVDEVQMESMTTGKDFSESLQNRYKENSTD